ncbi:MAG: hypothetical protein IT370_09595 [Deltaproteobacteria bacterium]|nr:hypothetical protein [Deltaproteobacteria bacterium]
MRLATTVVVLGALVVSLAGGVARVQAAPKVDDAAVAKAKEHYKKGTFFYDTGEFDKAIAEYLAGYEVQSDPVFLFNIAQSHRQLGNHDKAVFFYKSFLRNSPNAPNAEMVRQRIAELEELIQKKKESLEKPPGSPEPPVSSGGVKPSPRPEPSASPVASPRPSPSPVKLPDPAKVAAGTDDGQAPGPVDGPGDGASRPIYKKWWFWTAIGVVAVGATVAVVAVSGGEASAPSADFHGEAF